VPRRNPVQFVVQRRREFVQRGVISSAQLLEEISHRGGHESRLPKRLNSQTNSKTGAKVIERQIYQIRG
jgi:hypothetical protein